MKTYIMQFNGQQGVVEFQSESAAERNILLKIEQLQSLTDSEQMTAMHWVESALTKAGHRRYHLTGIEGTGHRFTFTTAREGAGIGSY